MYARAAAAVRQSGGPSEAFPRLPALTFQKEIVIDQAQTVFLRALSHRQHKIRFRSVGNRNRLLSFQQTVQVILQREGRSVRLDFGGLPGIPCVRCCPAFLTAISPT